MPDGLELVGGSRQGCPGRDDVDHGVQIRSRAAAGEVVTGLAKRRLELSQFGPKGRGPLEEHIEIRDGLGAQGVGRRSAAGLSRRGLHPPEDRSRPSQELASPRNPRCATGIAQHLLQIHKEPADLDRCTHIEMMGRHRAKGCYMTAGRPKSAGSRLFHWFVALLTVPSLAWGAFVLGATPANAAALTSLSWTVSNNQISATAVTYSYSFKTATAGTIKTITFAVSGSGLAGTPTIVRELRDRRGFGVTNRSDDHVHGDHCRRGRRRHPDLHRVRWSHQQLPRPGATRRRSRPRRRRRRRSTPQPLRPSPSRRTTRPSRSRSRRA